MNRCTKSIVAALAVLLLAGGLFAVAGADNGLVTCPGPAYDDDCHYADGTPVQDHEINSGQWYRFNFAGEIYFGQPGLWADKVTDRNGNPFLSDAPAPGILMGLSSSGQPLHHGLYEGDTWKGQLNNAPKGPLTYRDNPGAVFRSNPDSAEEARIVYLADADNRVVRDDGEYYREERINGQWVRSVSYGEDDDAKDRAITNARNRSQGQGIAAAARPLFSGKLVGNTGQSRQGTTAIGSSHHDSDVAQSFVTGSHGAGYRLTGVRLDLFVGVGTLPTYAVTIRANSNGAPGGILGTLSKPSSLNTGLSTFTASGNGIDLAANTTYWLMIDVTADNSANTNLGIQRTDTNAEDSGGATGWSIGNTYKLRQYNVTAWIDGNEELKLEVHGSEK